LDLPSAIEAATERAENASGRRVERRIEHRLPVPSLDPLLFDQVLSNLLDIALRFSGPQGHAAVAVRREGANVTVQVEDDGPGIPRKDIMRIFGPFFRASCTDRIAAGTGLGLAIARGLTRATGGQILAESRILDGRGTRMSLRFPA
jgi:two-component system sensor histidine kinase KdpD